MRPLSSSSLAVAAAIHRGVRYGFDIMDATGLPSGTVYPVLGRMERRGLVASSWEEASIAREDGRPARRYYALTTAGEEALRASAAHYRSLAAKLPGLEALTDEGSGR